ncbi:hypothetical protein, conserved in T.vivax [Trypanosoma vivax Y486]|uniref:Variant surface glycoprotein (VSG) n=1 Tax=Trypanosoma vivax (strain Y486) TaxID=1055687 RepID=F9WQE2_TRYVY|nr:hypothetical protein, conserved in T.vivax [Trypanosoma vivax Y486]|eukprot:CCD19770.1 hypothetical protein, conserved in T.vivax [Trypanosoma vivax Y486]
MLLQLRVAAWLVCAALCGAFVEGLGATKGQTAADFLVLCRAKRAADEAVLAATGAAGRVERCRNALWQAKKEHVSNGSWDEVNTTNAAQLCASGSLPECDAWRWSTEAASDAAEVKKLAAEAVQAGADTEEGAKETGDLFKTTMEGSTSENTGWGGRNAGQCLASDMMWLCNSNGDGAASTRWFATDTDNAPCSPAGNLAKLGIDKTSAEQRTHEWKEMKTGRSGADAARLATNWRIVKTICDALIPVTSPQKNLDKKDNTRGVGLVAGKLARAMEDFSKALHADDDTTAANVHALGKTSSDQNGCKGNTGGSDSSACVGYDTILASTRDLTKIPCFAKLKQIEQKLASLADVEQQCAAAERSAKHASAGRKRHAGHRTEETADEGMRKGEERANTPARQAHGTTKLDSKGGQTAHTGNKTKARTREACNEAHPRWHAGTRTCGDEANTQTDATVRTPNVLGSLATLATALAATTRKDVWHQVNNRRKGRGRGTTLVLKRVVKVKTHTPSRMEKKEHAIKAQTFLVQHCGKHTEEQGKGRDGNTAAEKNRQGKKAGHSARSTEGRNGIGTRRRCLAMSARRVRWVRNYAGTHKAAGGRLNKGNVRGDMAAGPNEAETTTNMTHNRTPQHAREDTEGVDRHANKRAEKKGRRKAKTCTATSGSKAQGNKEGSTRQGRRWHLREPRMRTHRAKALDGKDTAVKMAPDGGTRIRTGHVHRAHKHGSNKPQVTREKSAEKERRPHKAPSPERQRRKKTGTKGRHTWRPTATHSMQNRTRCRETRRTKQKQKKSQDHRTAVDTRQERKVRSRRPSGPRSEHNQAKQKKTKRRNANTNKDTPNKGTARKQRKWTCARVRCSGAHTHLMNTTPRK